MLRTVEIRDIFGGQTASQYFAGNGQYLAGIGIDPDLPVSDSAGDVLPSGIIRPSAYAKFSGTEVNANPYWLLNSPKTSLTYAYLNNGKVVSYDSSFASETAISTISSAAGQGAAYYNNYNYFATNTDIARYGPLDGVAAMTTGVWTGATLGSLTALVNTTYPSIRGSGVMPNHAMHVHSDNALYFGDFKNGQGLIHKIKTTKTTAEGDTNDGSAYNALDLPFGYMPVDIESYGTNLVIAAIQTSNSTIDQGKAALFFWDTISDSFYNQVPLPDSLVTALLNVRGQIYIWSAPGFSKGYRLSVYDGSYGVQTLMVSPDGSPPLAGAVDKFGDRILWGTHQQLQTTTPGTPDHYATVLALNSKDPRLPSGVHSVVKAPVSATSSDGYVTAVKVIEQDSMAIPRYIIGYRNASATEIAKRTTTYGTSIFRSSVINVGQRFTIKRLMIPLEEAVAANMTITPKIYTDNFTTAWTDSNSGLRVINNTNYANSEKRIVFDIDASGQHDFVLELTFSGTVLSPVIFPIRAIIELQDD